MINFFTFGDAADSFTLNERTPWEQGLFAASANAKQCMNVPHRTFASFSHAAFAFCSHSEVNPALYNNVQNTHRITSVDFLPRLIG